MNPLFGPIVDIAGKVLDRVIPDKNKREEVRAQLELEFAKQEGALIESLAKSDIAQAAINQIEAGSSSFFVAAWRPAAGWCGVFGLAWACIIEPIFTWVAVVSGHPLTSRPEIDTGVLGIVLTGMLGISASRTYEKVQRIKLRGGK